MVLIIWGFMIYSQVDFLLSKDLGFNRDNVIVIDAPTFKNKNFAIELEGFKNRLATLPGVREVTQCTSEMGGPVWDVGLRKPGHDRFIFIDTNGGVDEKFLPFFISGFRLFHSLFLLKTLPLLLLNDILE